MDYRSRLHRRSRRYCYGQCWHSLSSVLGRNRRTALGKRVEPGTSIDPLNEIKKLVAAVFDWPGEDVPDINLAVVELVYPELQTEQLALGGDLRGDNQFIIADEKQGVANNLYWPAGSKVGNTWKISDGGVNRTLQWKDWWFEVMDGHDYIFGLMNNEQINSMINYLNQSAGKSIGYVRILGND